LKERHNPLPTTRKEVEDIGEVCLTSGRVNYGLKRNAKEGEAEDEDEYPKDESKHGIDSIPPTLGGAIISA